MLLKRRLNIIIAKRGDDWYAKIAHTKTDVYVFEYRFKHFTLTRRQRPTNNNIHEHALLMIFYAFFLRLLYLLAYFVVTTNNDDKLNA